MNVNKHTLIPLPTHTHTPAVQYAANIENFNITLDRRLVKPLIIWHCGGRWKMHTGITVEKITRHCKSSHTHKKKCNTCHDFLIILNMFMGGRSSALLKNAMKIKNTSRHSVWVNYRWDVLKASGALLHFFSSQCEESISISCSLRL